MISLCNRNLPPDKSKSVSRQQFFLSLAIRQTAAARFPPALSPMIVTFSGVTSGRISPRSIAWRRRSSLLSLSGNDAPVQDGILPIQQSALSTAPCARRHGRMSPHSRLSSRRHGRTESLLLHHAPPFFIREEQPNRNLVVPIIYFHIQFSQKIRIGSSFLISASRRADSTSIPP